jgi:hypothetical protein
MQIRFKKGSGGPDTLHCTRDDGTQTWAPIPERFGPMHDLGHFVVEAALGLRGGFYGLLAQGYDLSSFVEEEDLSWIGEEGLLAETLVMALQYEIAGVAAPETFMEVVASSCRGLNIGAPELTPEVVEGMRARLRELWARWEELSPGESLTLTFEPGLCAG